MKTKIQDGIYSVKEKIGARLKAGYWETMRGIFDETNREVKNYVFCSVCKYVFRYDTNVGTKSLRDHSRICQPGKTFGRFVAKNKTNFTNVENKQIVEAAVRFCCKDLRPFFALHGEGLMDLLLEALVGICAQHGRLSRESLRSLLPCPNSVSKFTETYPLFTNTECFTEIHFIVYL